MCLPLGVWKQGSKKGRREGGREGGKERIRKKRGKRERKVERREENIKERKSRKDIIFGCCSSFFQYQEVYNSHLPTLKFKVLNKGP